MEAVCSGSENHFAYTKSNMGTNCLGSDTRDSVGSTEPSLGRRMSAACLSPLYSVVVDDFVEDDPMSE